MNSSIHKPTRTARAVFLCCLIVFVLITVAGLVLMHVYDDRMETIAVSCGLHSDPVNRWGALCVDRYSRGHIGRVIWWGPILTVGIAGTAASGAALLAVLGRHRSRLRRRAASPVSAPNGRSLRTVRIGLLGCLIAFALITVAGLVLTHVHDDRMKTIELSCLQYVVSNPAPANAPADSCGPAYVRQRMGYVVWSGPVLRTGVTGAAVSGIALVVAMSPGALLPGRRRQLPDPGNAGRE